MTQIRWRIYWNYVTCRLEEVFYEAIPFEEPKGTLWSMEVAEDNITHMGVLL